MLKELLNFGLDAYQQFRQNELQRNHSPLPGAATSTSPAGTAREGDAWTPGNGGNPDARPIRVPVAELKRNLGHETAQLQHRLRQTLASLGVPAGTPLQVQKTEIGTLAVEGRIPEPLREQIEQKLNGNTDLRAQFNQVSQHRPAVDFISNAQRLQDAYGASNHTLNSLLSRNEEHNNLQSLAQRMERLRGAQGTQPADALMTRAEQGFRLAVQV